MDGEMDEIAKPRSRLFAVDYDDTFSADPQLFSDFINMAKNRGHRVICVTARRATEENLNDIEAAMASCLVNVYFSNLTSKTEYMRKLGIKVDIWIDDSPYALVHGHV